MLNGMSPTNSRIVMHHFVQMFYTDFAPNIARQNRMRAFRDLKRYVQVNCPTFTRDVSFVLKHLLRLRAPRFAARAHATTALNKGGSSQAGAARYKILFSLVAEVLLHAGTTDGDTLLEMIYF